MAAVQEVAAGAARDLDCEALGIILENKRTVLAVHYRLAADPVATRHAILTRVIEPARARGLAVGTGHFAFEVRPPLPFSQGSAVRRLLDGGGLLTAMACGDDLTDVTAFESLRAGAERLACLPRRDEREPRRHLPEPPPVDDGEALLGHGVAILQPGPGDVLGLHVCRPGEPARDLIGAGFLAADVP